MIDTKRKFPYFIELDFLSGQDRQHKFESFKNQ
jgi:hypothetical protein